MRLTVSCLCVVLLGCAVDDIDFTGKTCSAVEPCPSGLTCNGGTCSTACGYNVSSLLMSWRAPNSLRWSWETTGDPTRLSRFELELTAQGQAPRVWTRNENPELGSATLQRGVGASLVRSTLITGLQPNTEYSATLRAININGCVSTSSTNAATASPPTNPGAPIVYFDETAAPGFSIPSSMRIVLGDGAVSNRHLEYSPDTDPVYADAGIAVGFQNLRRAGLPASLIVRAATTQFSTTYLESYIRYANGSEPGWYSEAWLRIYSPDGGDCGDVCVFGTDAFTLPVASDGGYRRYQFPLRAMRRRSDGGAFTAQELGQGVSEVKIIGSLFTRGSVVSLDGVRIWY